MYLQQAIYTSANHRHMQGYQLVSRSAGIGEEHVHELCRWSPSHGSLFSADSDAWSLNFFRAGGDWLAISRTFHGGPEYSDRGGTKVITHILVCDPDQLAAYDNNPLRLSELAMALGYFRWQPLSTKPLPELSFPDRPLPSAAWNTDEAETTGEVMSRLEGEVWDERRVALFGECDVFAILRSLFMRTEFQSRLSLTFTTGLRPSVRRPFHLHFVPVADRAIRGQLENEGVVCLDATPPVESARRQKPNESAFLTHIGER